MDKTATLGIRISEETMNRLKAYAKRQDLSVSDVVRILIRKALEREEA